MTEFFSPAPSLNSNNELFDKVGILSFPVNPAPALHEAFQCYTANNSTILNDVSWLDQASAVKQFLVQYPKGIVVILLAQPVDRLAASLQAEQSLSESMEICLAEFSALQDILTIDRRRILLIDLAEAVKRPSSLGESLRGHRGLNFPGLANLELVSADIVPEAYRALALLSLQERPEAHRLSDEIAASLLPVNASGQNHLPWESGIEELIRLEAAAKRAQEQDAIAPDLDRLRMQYASLEADLTIVARAEATMVRRNFAMMKENVELELERDKARIELTEARRCNDATNERIHAFERQVAKLESERDKARIELAEAQRCNDTTNERAQAFERQVAELHTSTSWRLTAPMRTVKRAFISLRTGRS